MAHEVKAALIGLGNVGRNLLRILETKHARLAAQYGLALRVVCVADSSGVAVAPAGFDPAAVRRAKEQGIPAAGMAGYLPGQTPAAVLAQIECDLMFEASPVNLQSGEPGLSNVRAALSRGMSVVLANKGPLVLAFVELDRLARRQGAGLGYSATVCGALPVVNIGQRDLVAADIQVLRGIFNSTTNFILAEMAAGRPYGEALAEAQARGIAETDPSLDVEGWDTANKLVILANAVLGRPTMLADVAVQGITEVTPAALRAAQAAGRTIKLVATAEAVQGGYRLEVAPVALPQDDFLATCHGWEMGMEYTSDLYGRMYHKIWEREPLPTAAAMVRDAVNLLGAQFHHR
jgi:homoserine dehydrogenase